MKDKYKNLCRKYSFKSQQFRKDLNKTNKYPIKWLSKTENVNFPGL